MFFFLSKYSFRSLFYIISVSKAGYSNDDNNNNVFSYFDSIFPGATSLALQTSIQYQIPKISSCSIVDPLEPNTYPTFDISVIAPSINSSILGTKYTFKTNNINESIESIDISQKSIESGLDNMLPEENEEYDSLCCESK